ncbi:MAG TPA: TonB family protein [Pyrinomonadaceae bacterium]
MLTIFFVGACLFKWTGTCFGAPAGRQTAAAQQTAANVSVAADTANGIALYKEGRYEEAIGVLQGAVKRRNRDAQAWLHLGIALARAGKNKEARKAFEKTLKLQPATPQAQIGIAYILLESDKTSEAERAVQRALALDPLNAESHYALGLIHLRRGAPEQAVAEADATLRGNPNFAGAFLLRSRAFQEIHAKQLTLLLEKYLGIEIPPMFNPAPDERARLARPLEEAAKNLEQYAALLPASQDAAPLKKEAESLRAEVSELVGGGNAPLIYSANDVTTKAKITSKPEPLYTEEARNKQVSGTIRLRILLGSDGRIRYVQVLNHLPAGLTEKAVAAARGIRFTPATKDGRRVSQFVTIEYNFNIY